MVKLTNEDFKINKIGRGKWNDWHSVGFSITTRNEAIHEYEHVMISCSKIRCKDCHEHANAYISETSDYVFKFLTDRNLTDSEIIDKYNRWLYDFHNTASLNSNKNPSSFPSYEEVADYYMNFEICEAECHSKN